MLKSDTDEDKLKLKRELGIPDDATVIGCCARLERVKGQDLILRAAALLKHKLPNLFYLFVGDGSVKDELYRTAAAAGLLHSVKFTGYVHDPARYQNLFYLNVNASRGTETSCLASSECMSLGIPSVVSSFGGNCEMFDNGINGLIFPTGNAFALADAIFRAVTDKELYASLSLGARAAYEKHFSSKRMADDYRRLYREAHRRYKIESYF
jgi:glycosyltransferase involved in cell wall biosynthesis